MSDYEGAYAIRIRPAAQRDIDEATNLIASLRDEKHAKEWRDSLLKKLVTLATLLRRAPIADENRLFISDVRVIPYRLSAGGTAYRVFFSIQEPAEDAPFVNILHIRHGVRKPMTRAEARKVESDTP